MGLIPESKIAEIRDRTDIVAIIGEHVPLRRAGVNHLGLCPFHQEKSPSFNVSASKQFFYCFGCQKSGDVFRFLMELEGRTFVDVARDLARRAGVDIPEEAAEASPQRRAQRLQQESERARLLKLCELAARFYEAQLAEHERARHYIESRGISAEIRARFRLGYAPPAWDALIRAMAQRGVPHELAESAGLVLRKEGVAALPAGAPATAHSHYDRFRDRVMFPLLVPIIGPAARAAGATALGDVIAFGGRVLPEAHSEGAKYINSPETPLYKKGDNLYGLHAAREPIRQRRQVVLVEGNFDVLALHQHGFENTVAPMGTALTEAQIQKLSRLLGSDGHVVLMLDGDKAGRSATMKDIALFMFSQANLSDVALLSQRDVDVRVARLPDGEDPDTFAQRDREGLARCVRAAKPALDYVLDEAIAQAEHDSVAGKAKVLAKVAPLLKSLRNQTVQELHVDRLASSLSISTDLVWRHLQGVQIPSVAAIT
ncbi:MAG TPA: DNA primase, partial [Pseudomonadota bacterium]|nr:DNA primase [Pseudomonadota bacterium]